MRSLSVLLYLLPLSGDLLLQDLLRRDSLEVKAAVLPERFLRDCESIIAILEQNDIPHNVPQSLDDPTFRSWVNSRSYDLGLSVGYDKKLPGWLIDLPSMSTINIHPSLLPRYRGANPYFWVLHNLEETTGVSLHYMDEDLDTGPIIAQEETPIGERDTMGDLFFELARLGVDMAHDVLDDIQKRGKPPDARPQPDAQDPPRAPRVEEDHLRIDWDRPRRRVLAHIRAGNPFFGAFTTFQGTKVRLYEARPIRDPDLGEPVKRNGVRPGRIHATEGGPVIRCGDGWIRVRVVEVEQRCRCSGVEWQRRQKKAFSVLDRVI